jgi:ABC-type lipopolysaccharide export system ATPase subunit
VVPEVTSRAYVIETGKIVTKGDVKKLAGNDEIRKRYPGM